MSNVLACYQLLELNVISAQDLAPVGRSMRTYAVAWVDPDRKLSTRVDSHGGINPAWNDKFVFRVDDDFLNDENSIITIDIYALHWFKDIHVGTALVLADDIIPPSRPSHNKNYKPPGMRFVGLQVRRPSGRPKGILNVGVVVIDSSMRSMPLYTHDNTPAVGYHQDDHHNQSSHQAMPELRRTKSDTSSMMGSEVVEHEKRIKAQRRRANSQVTPSEVSTDSKKKTNSTLSGSDVKAKPTTKKGKFGKTKKNYSNERDNISYEYEVKPSPKPQFQNTPARTYNKGGVRATPLHAFAVNNATMEYSTPYRSHMGRHRPIITDSELGPSASEVAAVVARQPVMDEGDNSTIGRWSLDESVEELQPKIERWQTDLAPVYDGGEMSSVPTSSKKKGKHSRRRTESSSGGGGGGGNGLFSCFSVICGLECSIVCGGDNKKSRLRRTQSIDDDASFI
ncbi:uncharacterized protein [Cicer arietinum]|uniref:Uncharacterized protein LOC101505544 n=1 Tax=Cicer arietinum TaxID=3827 RepID=A0A3Q7Y9N6_CICAR|nr:uncharacterized protein LOC101505544 [Cicer arietinum]